VLFRSNKAQWILKHPSRRMTALSLLFHSLLIHNKKPIYSTKTAAICRHQNCTREQVSTMARTATKRYRDSAQPKDIPDPDFVNKHLDKMLANAGIELTQTRGDWCLRSGLQHIMSTNNMSLVDLIVENGPPTIYHSIPCRHGDSAVQDLKKPSNCFESLCRIIAGQQLAGAAAQSVWKRLLETTNQTLTPDTILSLVAGENIEMNLQKPAGLSGAKARSIVDLSHHFINGKLSDQLLTSLPEESVRTLLLDVKGLGPWSCDMFLMFYLERSDILPLGDLGVRRGLARHFQVLGKAADGALCPKKDASRMLQIAAPYHPYRSLLSYYMWKAADITDFYNDTIDKKKSPKKKQKKTG